MPTADTGTVTMQIDGDICTITVDNQSKKNAYTPAMLDRRAELLTEYEDHLWMAIICQCAPLGLRAIKQAARTFIEAGEAAAIACLPAIRQTVFASEAFREGVQSFVERRAATFSGR